MPRAEEQVSSLEVINQVLTQELERAKETYKSNADTQRAPAPDFKVGEKVWLLHRNITSSRPSAKLESRKLGPYKITERLSPLVYRLGLPASMRIHPVFRVSLLEPYR